MAYDFPNSPAGGQVSGNYTWDGEKWKQTATGILPSSIAPPMDGAATAGTSLLYSRGDHAHPSPVALPILSINGGMQVSQELGTSGYYPITNNSKYVLDQFIVAAGGAVTLSGSLSAGGPPGFAYCMLSQSFTVIPSLAAGDYGFIWQPIEGARIARLGWGTAAAQPITIGFYIKSPITGNLGLSVGNGSRTYIVDINIPTANVWQWCTATIPGDTAGTWTSDNTVGMNIKWSFIVGSTYRTTPGAWQAGNFLGTASTMNLAASGSLIISLGSVIVVPGTSLPAPSVIPLLLPTYDQELVACQRYWNSTTVTARFWSPVAGSTLDVPIYFPPMRIAPSLTFTSGGTQINLGALNSYTFNTNSGAVAASSTATGDTTLFDAVCSLNARL